MRGVSYVVDDEGKRTAVQIDLREHGELWADLADVFRAEERRGEERESLDDVRRRLQVAGKLASGA